MSTFWLLYCSLIILMVLDIFGLLSPPPEDGPSELPICPAESGEGEVQRTITDYFSGD